MVAKTENRAGGFDALLPPEIAAKAENIGVQKAGLGFPQLHALAVLAGAFISMGAVFSTVVTTGAQGVLPFGLIRLCGGLAFCLGLVLVVIAGAELFTGNNLIVMAWASKKIRTAALLRNWGIVYAANLVGSLLTAYLIYIGGQHTLGGGAVGLNALEIARSKVGLEPLQAIILGMFCNALVCLAIWLTMSARTTTGKILAIVFPVTAFVTAGFEHSVANMYFIPAGIFIKLGAGAEFWAEIGRNAADYASLTWSSFVVANLLPVTVGNIIGGSLMVALIYWAIYRR